MYIIKGLVSHLFEASITKKDTMIQVTGTMRKKDAIDTRGEGLDPGHPPIDITVRTRGITRKSTSTDVNTEATVTADQPLKIQESINVVLKKIVAEITKRVHRIQAKTILPATIVAEKSEIMQATLERTKISHRKKD